METRMEHSPLTIATKPLAGLTVVTIEQALAASLCTGRLAEMGARVIKIEHPEGDYARGYDKAAHGHSFYFLWTIRGKESLVLDFKKPRDAELLIRILNKADVFVQNVAPSALARAGFSSKALRERHPRLITCDITGYGTGAESTKLKAYDLLVQCESVLIGVSGSPDSYGRIGVSICDIGAGMNATIAILSALAYREQTGHGTGVTLPFFGYISDRIGRRHTYMTAAICIMPFAFPYLRVVRNKSTGAGHRHYRAHDGYSQRALRDSGGLHC